MAEQLQAQETRNAYFDTVREKLAGAKLPDVEEKWEKCGCELEYYKTGRGRIYTGYTVWYRNSGQYTSYGMNRNYGEDREVIDVISAEDLKLVEDEYWGTIYCASWGGDKKRITAFRYDEELDLWDMYWIVGDHSYEELIADLRTCH